MPYRENTSNEPLNTFCSLYNRRQMYYKSFLSCPLPEKTIRILQKIKNKKYKKIVVYPHAVLWQPVQRPQQLLREFAKKGYLCFFCDAPAEAFEITEIQENLFVINNEAYLLPLLMTRPVIVLCTWLMQLAFADLIPDKFIWYDLLDKLEFFALYDEGMLEKHVHTLKKADFVSYTAEALKRYVLQREDAVYLPNACNPDDFKIEDHSKIPPEMKNWVESKKPIIGYFGAVEEWFNAELIKGIAKNNPHWQFVIIGKVGIEAAQLADKNIHLLGLIPYQDLHKYAKHFNVAIIPFIVNDLTNCVSPIKFFEYAALGKPVVSSSLLEMKKYQYEWVFVANDETSFENAIRLALTKEIQSKAATEAPKFALHNQWLTRLESFEKYNAHNIN